MIDLNHGSQVVYGASQEEPITGRINTLIDRALVDRNRQQRPRTYLGGSRIGEPCARKLVYEYTRSPLDAGKDFDGRTLRIFDAPRASTCAPTAATASSSASSPPTAVSGATSTA